MTFWPWWPRRRPNLQPDIEKFNQTIIRSVYGRGYDGLDVAGDFRHLFNDNPQLGQRVLFMLLKWCGEYDPPPEDDSALQRWAGKREIADSIKAAMYADLGPQRNKTEEEQEADVRGN